MSPEQTCDYLERQIVLHSHRYYKLNDPVISDYAYDDLVVDYLRIAPRCDHKSKQPIDGATGMHLDITLHGELYLQLKD